MSKMRSISWARSAWFFLLVAVAILALNAGRLIYKGFPPSHVRAASAVAYTVFRTENVLDAGGTLRCTNHYVEAVRGDGSKMLRGTTKDVQQREIYFANGGFVITNELMGRKSTYPHRYPSPFVSRDPNASCASSQDTSSGIAGEDNIGGNRTIRMVMNLGAARSLTMWYGVDLGCAVLQQRFQHETGVTEQTLASVVPGEPDAALFQLSAALKEGPPSELYACSDGRPCTPLPDEMKQRMDKAYFDAR